MPHFVQSFNKTLTKCYILLVIYFVRLISYVTLLLPESNGFDKKFTLYFKKITPQLPNKLDFLLV